jgi:molybdopterin-guanine dinucleotide biosynthesis protein A
VAHPALTGVLLLGGASERFGSAKALARFHGETLAERTYRLLEEACDEVLAVGKQADGLALPFAVLDDGVADRAPVHGVLAGLRHATHDRCVVVPVDCPLLTPGALRALGESLTVAPGGPLPGAYAKAMVPLLDGRVAAGELSLRGVNPAVTELDERLFLDVDTRAELDELARPGHALVVGGTGMLAGVTAELAARGHPVTVVARRESTLPVSHLTLDHRDGDALRRGLAEAAAERGPFELAVVWAHTDAPDVPGLVAAATAPGGRVVQVFGTRVWPLAPVPVHVAYRQVLLGSAEGGRWLTHDEISRGTLEAIDADRPVHVVGRR